MLNIGRDNVRPVPLIVTICYTLFMVTVTTVALLVKDLATSNIFFLMYIGNVAIIFYIIISGLKHQSPSERQYHEANIYTIGVSEPAPSYETIFAMNTYPPPYEIAIKGIPKEGEESLTVVSVE